MMTVTTIRDITQEDEGGSATGEKDGERDCRMGGYNIGWEGGGRGHGLHSVCQASD